MNSFFNLIRFLVLLLFFIGTGGILNSSVCEAQSGRIKTPSEFVPNQLIVKFKSGESSVSRNSFFLKHQFQVIKQFPFNGAFLVKMQGGIMRTQAATMGALAHQLASLPEIEYVEPNWIVRATSKNKGHFVGPISTEIKNLDFPKAPERFFAPLAWSNAADFSPVLVAVIDSGVDYTHQDLVKTYWQNAREAGTDGSGRDKRTNGIDDDGNGKIDDWRGWNFIADSNDPMDDNEHGTHCAGTVTTIGNNGVNNAGMNGNVSLVGIKFLSREGVGTIADAVLAVDYAISLGVHVINNSWGGDEYSETMAAIIRKADAAGILFIVAAGNDSNNNDIGPDYPASYPIDNVISVAAATSDGQIAGFSNFGPRTVHIAAPGVQILSTIPGNQYARLDGTSMAAPFVSGAAALIKSRFPQLKAREIKARLLGGAIPSAALQPYVKTGLLNIENSLNSDFTPPPTPQRISLVGYSATFLDIEWDTSLVNRPDDLRDIYGYEIRYAQRPIDSEFAWQSSAVANIILGPVQVSGKAIRLRVNGFPLNSRGYFVMRTFDRSGNWSSLTPSNPYSLQTVTLAYYNQGDNLEGLSIEGNWGVETLTGYGRVLSDSPGGNYGYGQTTTLTLPSITLNSAEAILTFDTKFDLELGYDFGYLEFSADRGNSWTQMAIFNGARSWTSYAFSVSPPPQNNLSSVLNQLEYQLLFRFRITSDRTTSKDGWYLSNISILR